MPRLAEVETPAAARAAERRAAVRAHLLATTKDFVAEHGFRDVQISLIAHRAGVSVGAIYKHFPSRSDLLAEVYVLAVRHEFELVQAAVDAAAGSHERIRVGVETFCRRALEAGRFAHALLTEPTDPAVDEHRLAVREEYRVLFAGLIADGIAAGELPDQDADVAAAAVLGIMTEALVRPLVGAGAAPTATRLVPRIVSHCLATVGAR